MEKYIILGTYQSLYFPLADQACFFQGLSCGELAKFEQIYSSSREL